MSENLQLSGADLKVLLQVFKANLYTLAIGLPEGTPYLYSGRSWKRARHLCQLGLLKLHEINMTPPHESMVPVTITQDGIEAYNREISNNA